MILPVQAHGSSSLQPLPPTSSEHSGSWQVATKKSCHPLHSVLGTEHNGTRVVGAGVVGAGVVGARVVGVVGAGVVGVVGANVVGAADVTGAWSWSLSRVKSHIDTDPTTTPTPTPTAKAQRIGVQPYLVAQDGGPRWSHGLWLSGEFCCSRSLLFRSVLDPGGGPL